MNHFEGQTVIVTGSGRGIGRETCELLARRGANVVVNDVGTDETGEGSSKQIADSVVSKIESEGGTAVANYNDIGEPDGAERLIETAIEEFGQLDAVYNNAGIIRESSLVNMSEAEFDEVVRVHLKGTWGVMRSAGRHWREKSKEGTDREFRVVNASSDSSAGVFSPVAGTAHGLGNYAAAKAGILGLTRCAAEEFANYDVRVNAIWPVARTRLTEDLPMDIPGPEPVAHLVSYLLSNHCQISGRTMRIKGEQIDLLSPAQQTQYTAFSGHDSWTLDELLSKFQTTIGAEISDPLHDLGV
jgi:NAD(P)-dependent dehydrogenase (short-subunit alcohol dehydrogenase family)